VTAQPPGRFVTANGVRQHFLELGAGDRAVVICHKVTGGAETWAAKAAELASRYRVVVPDLRGHGYSHKPDWGYSLVDYARDVAGLIEALGLNRPVVVGHSLGGRVALQLGARHAGAVGAVVAVDPPLSGPGRPRYPYSLASFTAWQEAVRTQGVAASLASSTPYTLEEAELRTRYGLLHTTNAMVESWFGFHLEDVHALVRDLAVPALLLYGDRGVVNPAQADEVRQLNPAVTVRPIADAGHNVPWDNWPALRRELLAFVDAVTR
jgi:N-formylmaleamate deformylase